MRSNNVHFVSSRLSSHKWDVINLTIPNVNNKWYHRYRLDRVYYMFLSLIKSLNTDAKYSSDQVIY